MKRYYFFLILLIISLSVYAQHVRVSAPRHVSVGEEFQLEYTIGSQNVNSFRLGNMPKGLEVVYGPATSSQSSFQMINGHTSSSSSITYTYVVIASHKGTYHIPPAQMTVNGVNLASSPIRVTASGTTSRPASNGNYNYYDDQAEMEEYSSPQRVGKNDLFIRVTASKQRVHEQEPVLLTYKVYTTVDLTHLDEKMPDLDGFHTQKVKLPQQKTFSKERVGNRIYKTVTWSQYVMYPQMTGKLVVPPITFHGVVMLENRDIDPFEAFVTGGGYKEVKKDIKAPGVTITVDPLPKSPKGFSYGVGRFNITSQLEKKEVKAGEPVNMRIVISGSGNLKLIKAPQVTLPKDIEKYDPKVTDKTHLTAHGVEGNMIYDILIVPQKMGNYTIPPVSFTYYDTSSNNYKTIRTQSYDLHVLKGDGAGSVSDFSYQDSRDIHQIKEGEANIHAINHLFFASTGYWIALAVLVAIFVALLIVFRKRAIEHADMARLRGKNASKVAKKRLRKADMLMHSGKANEFYDEVLHALWGYVGDKLNIPVEALSRDNVREAFHKHLVDDTTIDQFLGALDECEFERYAPGDTKGNMNRTFETAVSAIMNIENSINHRSNNSSVLALTLVLIMMFLPVAANAVTKQNADAEYRKGNYHQAIVDYEEILRDAVSAEVYYNLGNAYYRTDNITKAVLNYERALMLSPGDEDIRFNLEMARSKTIDKITPESEMFFAIWYKAIVNIMSVDGWAFTAIISMILLIILVLFYLFSDNITVRKIGFFGGFVFVILFMLSNVFAYQQRRQFVCRTGAIVVSPSANVYDTPEISSHDQFVVHEGTRVDIVDASMKKWTNIRLADGRSGWIFTSNIEKI